MATTNDRLESLKRKYSSALASAERCGISINEVNLRDNKLYVKGAAPNAEAKTGFIAELENVDLEWNGEVQADVRLPGDEPPHTGQSVVNTSTDFATEDRLHSRT